VVNIEIDDGDALHAVAGPGIERGNRGVGEKAEAHGAVVLGMMPRRADLRERIRRALGHHRVDRLHSRPDAAQHRLPRSRRHHGIAVDAHEAALAHRLLPDTAHPVEVVLGVSEQDGGLDIVA